jgi:DNA polymerase III subunit beta
MMEILLPKADLVRELYFLQGVVERKSAIAILSNVLLEARAGEICLSATDLDLSLRSECAAQVVADGSVTVNAKKLFEVARSLPESDVHLKVESDNWLSIECEHVSFRLSALPKEDFPTLPQRNATAAPLEIEAEALRDLIQRTSFAITGEDARYYLSGALLVVEAADVAVVATDGHRLAYAKREGAVRQGTTKRMLVPRKAVHELQRLLEAGGTVAVEESGNHLLFSAGRRTLASKLVEGQFPSFENVIAVTGDKIVQLPRETFLAAIRRVSLVAAERTKAVRLALSQGKLTLTATSTDLGEARETLAVEYDGPEVTIGFNAQYIQEFLAVVPGEAVALELKNADSQGVLRPVGDTHTDHRYVVMPMRL